MQIQKEEKLKRKYKEKIETHGTVAGAGAEGGEKLEIWKEEKSQRKDKEEIEKIETHYLYTCRWIWSG